MQKYKILWIIIWLINCVPVSAVNYNDFIKYKNNNRFDSALIIINDLLKDNPENYDYLFQKGLVLSWTKKYEKAISIMKKIISEKPAYYDAHLSLARIYFWQEDIDSSLSAVEELLKFDHDNIEALVFRAKLLSIQKKYEPAIKELKRVIEKTPNHKQAYIQIATVYAWSEDYVNAIEILDILSGKFGSSSEEKELRKKVLLWSNANSEEYEIYDNILLDKSENKDFISRTGQAKAKKKGIKIFSKYNLVKDYNVSNAYYPYKDITFRSGAGYFLTLNKRQAEFYYSTGEIKQKSYTWNDNEYLVIKNSLTAKTFFSLFKSSQTVSLSLNRYNDYKTAYYKLGDYKTKINGLFLNYKKLAPGYRLYLAYSLDEWFRKEGVNILHAENLHTYSISLVYSKDRNKKLFLNASTAVYDNDNARDYDDYAVQWQQDIKKFYNNPVNLKLKYKFRKYDSTDLNFYYISLFYTGNYRNKYYLSPEYEFSLSDNPDVKGHKFKLYTTVNINNKLTLKNDTTYYFQVSGDKDRDFTTNFSLLLKL